MRRLEACRRQVEGFFDEGGVVAGGAIRFRLNHAYERAFRYAEILWLTDITSVTRNHRHVRTTVEVNRNEEADSVLYEVVHLPRSGHRGHQVTEIRESDLIRSSIDQDMPTHHPVKRNRITYFVGLPAVWYDVQRSFGEMDQEVHADSHHDP